MRTRPVGRTGLQLTEVALGGAPLANHGREVSEQDARDVVLTAYEGGIRYVDTAPHYGVGLSERRIGAALRDLPRDRVVLSTKVGRRLVPDPGGADRRDPHGFDVPASWRRVWDFSRDGVRRSLEESLQRLGLDAVDIVYVHDPDDFEREALDAALPALAELREQGVVRAVGAGMNQSAMLTRFVREADVDVVMCAGRYTLLEQGPLDDLLPAAEERGVAVVAAAVFNSGLLSTDRPAPGATWNYAPAPPHLVERATRIAEVCERHGTTLPAAALHFPLAHPAVAAVAVGAQYPEQVRRNIALHAGPVPAELWADLVGEGLLRADAPTPSSEAP